MQYFTSYFTDFNQETKRYAFSVLYEDGNVTSNEDDLRYIPSSIRALYNDFEEGKGYCNLLGRPRRLRIFTGTDTYLTCILPNYSYTDALNELNNLIKPVKYRIIGERVISPFAFSKYVST